MCLIVAILLLCFLKIRLYTLKSLMYNVTKVLFNCCIILRVKNLINFHLNSRSFPKVSTHVFLLLSQLTNARVCNIFPMTITSSHLQC